MLQSDGFGPCTARKLDLPVDLQVFCVSGGVGVFVDQAAQDRFSAHLLSAGAGHGGAGSVRFAAGDALGDALVRPGRVVVQLILSQDRAQMSLAEDQHPVEKLTRAIWPPASSNATVWLSNAGTRPMSWNIAATYSSSGSKSIPRAMPSAAAHS
jgi:hypothetical protein